MGHREKTFSAVPDILLLREMPANSLRTDQQSNVEQEISNWENSDDTLEEDSEPSTSEAKAMMLALWVLKCLIHYFPLASRVSSEFSHI